MGIFGCSNDPYENNQKRLPSIGCIERLFYEKNALGEQEHHSHTTLHNLKILFLVSLRVRLELSQMLVLQSTGCVINFEGPILLAVIYEGKWVQKTTPKLGQISFELVIAFCQEFYEIVFEKLGLQTCIQTFFPRVKKGRLVLWHSYHIWQTRKSVAISLTTKIRNDQCAISFQAYYLQ